MEKPTTKIDAVQLVRRIRDAHYEELKEASRADRIAFYNSKTYNSKTRAQQPGTERARKSAV